MDSSLGIDCIFLADSSIGEKLPAELSTKTVLFWN
jgi:hypothetical protein